LEIRNRLRTLVPPEIIEAGKTGKPLPQKQPQPGPEEVLLQLKKQELEQRAMQAQQEAQLKIQELELKRQEMHRKAIETQQDMTIAFEKLDADKEQAAARLQETMLRYTAEAERVGADLHMNQANHLMQILLHRDKHEQRESRIG
jgi:membrane protein involved in colicin uptake